MPSQFERTERRNLTDKKIDPWIVLEHLVGVLQEGLRSAEQTDGVALSARFDGGKHEASSVADLRAQMRPSDLDHLEKFIVHCWPRPTAITGPTYRSDVVFLHVTLRNRRDETLSLAANFESPREQFVDGWIARFAREFDYIEKHPTRFETKIVSTRPELPEPPLTLEATPAPQKNKEKVGEAESKGIVSYLREVSINAVGGVLAVAIVAVAALLWALLK